MAPDLVETIGDVPSASSEEDVTESIVPSAPAAAPVAPAVVAPPEQASRTKVSGWARESLELYADDNGLVFADPSDVARVPRDRLSSRTQLLARATYQRGRWFEATVSGTASVNVQVESSGRGLKPYELGSQRTDVQLDARLLELYLGFFARAFDLRIGQQRVAWGVADIVSPNDVVNARDASDPFFAEPELLRIPTPLLRGTLYFGSLSLELLASPLFVPDRASLYGSNWSAVQPDAPAAFRGLFALLAHRSDPTIQEKLNDAVYQTRLPNRGGRGSSLGVKATLHVEGFDANLYYHNGFDGTPHLWVDPTLFAVLQTADFGEAGLSALLPALRAADAGLPLIVAEYVRRHHVGFDAVVPVGPLMVRFDAAYQSQRVFYRRDLRGFVSPALSAVLSLDYQTGSVDKLLVVEAVYIRVMDAITSPLLVYERDSYGFGAITRWPLFSLFSFEARVLVGIAPSFYTLQPALLLKSGDFVVRAGAFFTNGEANSLGWYYRHNTTGLLQVRYGF